MTISTPLSIVARVRRARRIARKILDAAASLSTHPYRHRNGCVPGTHECIVSPYLRVYEIHDDETRVPRCLQGRRRWPMPD